MRSRSGFSLAIAIAIILPALMSSLAFAGDQFDILVLSPVDDLDIDLNTIEWAPSGDYALVGGKDNSVWQWYLAGNDWIDHSGVCKVKPGQEVIEIMSTGGDSFIYIAMDDQDNKGSSGSFSFGGVPPKQIQDQKSSKDPQTVVWTDIAKGLVDSDGDASEDDTGYVLVGYQEGVGGKVYFWDGNAENNFIELDVDTDGAPTAEVSTVTCAQQNDGGGNVIDSGEYFLLHSITTEYHVWYDVDNGGGAPGGNLIEIDISSGDTAIQVAQATETFINAHPSFSATRVDDVVTITTALGGDTDNIANNNLPVNPFNFGTSINGVDKPDTVILDDTHYPKSAIWNDDDDTWYIFANDSDNDNTYVYTWNGDASAPIDDLQGPKSVFLADFEVNCSDYDSTGKILIGGGDRFNSGNEYGAVLKYDPSGGGTFTFVGTDDADTAGSAQHINGLEWHPSFSPDEALVVGKENVDADPDCYGIYKYLDDPHENLIQSSVIGNDKALNDISWHPDGAFAVAVGGGGDVVQYFASATGDDDHQVQGTVQNSAPEITDVSFELDAKNILHGQIDPDNNTEYLLKFTVEDENTWEDIGENGFVRVNLWYDAGVDNNVSVDGIDNSGKDNYFISFVYNEESGAVSEDLQDVGTSEISTITCVSDVAGSLDGTYFVIYTMTESVALWFDHQDSGTPMPAGAGEADRQIEINNVKNNEDKKIVAQYIFEAINIDPSFTATFSGDDFLDFSPNTVGNVNDPVDGENPDDTGFTFATADGSSEVVKLWGNVDSRVVVNQVTANQKYTFGIYLKFHKFIRQADEPTSNGVAYSNGKSWNAEIVVNDGDGGEHKVIHDGSRSLEFGVYKYTEINIGAGNWLFDSGGPGDQVETDQGTGDEPDHFRFASNDDFKMRFYFKETFKDASGEHSIPVTGISMDEADSSGAFAGIGIGNSYTFVDNDPGGKGDHDVEYISYDGNPAINNLDDTYMPSFSMNIPVPQYAGTYSATLVCSIVQV